MEELPESRRMKVVYLGSEALATFLTSCTNKVIRIKGLPDGAKSRGFCHVYERNAIASFWEHESFEKIPFGHMIPELQISISKGD